MGPPLLLLILYGRLQGCGERHTHVSDRKCVCVLIASLLRACAFTQAPRENMQQEVHAVCLGLKHHSIHHSKNNNSQNIQTLMSNYTVERGLNHFDQTLVSYPVVVLPERKLLWASSTVLMCWTHTCLISRLAACSVKRSDDPRQDMMNLHGSLSTFSSTLRKLTFSHTHKHSY